MYHNEMPNPTNNPDDEWSYRNLGSIFGLTLDTRGNIYVTASSSYRTDVYGTAGPGGVYRISGNNGAISTFAMLPQPTTGAKPALGNIDFGPCNHPAPKFYVSNFHDGLVYALDETGAIVATYDPFSSSNDQDQDGWADLGERIWAVKSYAGRLYFSRWHEDASRPNPMYGNEVHSVALDANGLFLPATERLELTTPPRGANWSMPIADIDFSPTGALLLAERGMASDSAPTAHRSRVLAYTPQGNTWIPSSTVYGVGAGNGSAAGGVAADFNVNNPYGVWATADGMSISNPSIYGLQGLPATGGGLLDSLWIDLNGKTSVQDKNEIGDVAIACRNPEVTPFLDLAVGNLASEPVMVRCGEEALVTFTVHNLGTEPAPPTDLVIELVGNSLGDRTLFTGETPFLEPNASRDYEIVVIVPGDLHFGPGWMKVTVDGERLVFEEDESNNELTFQVFLID
jgi:hypothetical protein